MNPLISIVTINYNNAEGLRKTMRSVLSQTGVSPEKIEYIVVDGGSKDGSVEVIEEFEKCTDLPLKISRWVSEPDKGIYNAMNKGIRMATGEYLHMLNSGDWFVNENILNAVSSLLKDDETSVLYGAVNQFRNDKFVQTSGMSADLLPEVTIAHQSCFVPKRFHNEFGLYDEKYKIAADYDFFLKLYVGGAKFHFSNLIVANYDLSGISSVDETVLLEIQSIKNKYGYSGIAKRRKLLRCISLFVPYGLVLVARKIIEKNNSRQ